MCVYHVLSVIGTAKSKTGDVLSDLSSRSCQGCGREITVLRPLQLGPCIIPRQKCRDGCVYVGQQ